MPEVDARKLYTRWLHELWPTADRGLAEQLVTETFVGHWPGRDVTGPPGLVTAIEQSLSLFADVATSIDVGPIVDGDLVAARWTFRGTYRGGMPDATVSPGTPAVLRGADVLRLAGGQFAEYWVSSDVAELMAQLRAG